MSFFFAVSLLLLLLVLPSRARKQRVFSLFLSFSSVSSFFLFLLPVVAALTNGDFQSKRKRNTTQQLRRLAAGDHPAALGARLLESRRHRLQHRQRVRRRDGGGEDPAHGGEAAEGAEGGCDGDSVLGGRFRFGLKRKKEKILTPAPLHLNFFKTPPPSLATFAKNKEEKGPPSASSRIPKEPITKTKTPHLLRTTLLTDPVVKIKINFLPHAKKEKWKE